MKKQAIAFFTMFSLILMLSIYYITLPNESSHTSKKPISVIADLEKDKDALKKTNKEHNDDIISDPNTSEENKQEAIVKNETLKATKAEETKISEHVKSLGHESIVEIKEKTLYIKISSQAEEGIASQIMKEVYKLIGDKYFIEVSFNS